MSAAYEGAPALVAFSPALPAPCAAHATHACAAPAASAGRQGACAIPLIARPDPQAVPCSSPAQQLPSELLVLLCRDGSPYVRSAALWRCFWPRAADRLSSAGGGMRRRAVAALVAACVAPSANWCLPALYAGVVPPQPAKPAQHPIPPPHPPTISPLAGASCRAAACAARACTWMPRR